MRQTFTTNAGIWKAAIGLTAAGACSTPAIAQGGDEPAAEFDGMIEYRTVLSDLDFNEGEDIDSSGVGVRARIGAEFNLSPNTKVRAEGEARLFEFRDTARDSLETLIGRVELTQGFTQDIEVRLHARRYENIAVLEAFSADQTSVGARVQYERGNDRLRVEAEYREREYDTTVPAEGDGYRVSAQYNRRLGSYHWVRFDLRHEDMKSEEAPRRSYDRQVARVKYSHPISKKARVRPSLEYRQWDYDTRIALGDPDGGLRKDSYVAPGIEMAAGNSARGLYGVAGVEYRIRSSNDERFSSNAVRLGIRVSYRF